MTRALFFVILVACGGRPAARVEVAQPLPTVTATAVAATAPTRAAPPPSAPAAPDDVRDPRPATVRSSALLRKEAPILERLLAATAQNSPDRPELMFRLAETYVDLRKLGDAGASANAIAHYAALDAAYPQFAKADDAEYGLALEYETTGDFVRARREYFELIRKHPQSRWVPYAYYAFGELFFREGKTDPSKWPLAEQAYIQVMKFGTGSAITPEALCRLSQVYDAQNAAARAAKVRMALRDAYPNSPAANRCGAP